MNDISPKSRANPLPSNKTGMVLVAFVVLILLMVGLYFWGTAQTRNQLSAQEAEYQQRMSAVDAQLKETRRELGAVRNRNHLLMARTDLYRTAGDLDQRNFGIANTRLQQAEAALRRVDAAAGGLDAARLETLRASIKGMNINVATDLQDQRNAVLELASRLDEMTSEDAAASVAR